MTRSIFHLIKKEWEAFQSGTWFCWFTRYTLRSLLSILFYQTAWSEFFQKVSIKQPGPSQKKLILLFYFRAATANFWSLLNNLVWIFGKVSSKRPILSFSNSRSQEWPGLIIESLEYLPLVSMYLLYHWRCIVLLKYMYVI